MRCYWHETAAAGVSVMDQWGRFAGFVGFVVAVGTAGAGLGQKIDQHLLCLRIVLGPGSIQKSYRRVETVPGHWWQMLARREAESPGEGCGSPRRNGHPRRTSLRHCRTTLDAGVR